MAVDEHAFERSELSEVGGAGELLAVGACGCAGAAFGIHGGGFANDVGVADDFGDVIQGPAAWGRSTSRAERTGCWGPRGLSANASTFTRLEVLQGWCGRLTGGANVLEVERLADRLLADTHPRAIRLTGTNSPIRTLVLRLVDGGWVRGGPADNRYSAPELLAIEQELVDTALVQSDTGRGCIPADVPERAIGRRSSVTRKQQHAVVELTSSGHGIDVVFGRAGIDRVGSSSRSASTDRGA